MVWNDQKDDYLCRELLLMETYKFKPRSRERGNAWKQIADALNAGSTESCFFKVDARAVRERFNLLLNHFKAKQSAEINATGISPEPTPPDDALEHLALAQRVEECEEEQKNQSNENIQKVEKEKLAAEDLRQKAMETFAETKVRKKLRSESDDESPKLLQSQQQTQQVMAIMLQMLQQRN